MDEKIQAAKELLWENGYVIRKISDQMNKDANECDAMGGDKECFGCSCSVCIVR